MKSNQVERASHFWKVKPALRSEPSVQSKTTSIEILDGKEAFLAKRILSVDVGTGEDGSECVFAVLAHADRFFYVRHGIFNPHNIELFEAMLTAENYDVVAIERGFLVPGRVYGKTLLLNAENSAKLHLTAFNWAKAQRTSPTVIWISQPQWSRYLYNRGRAASSKEVEWVVSRMVVDLPKKLSSHAVDAIGLGIVAFHLAQAENAMAAQWGTLGIKR